MLYLSNENLLANRRYVFVDGSNLVQVGVFWILIDVTFHGFRNKEIQISGIQFYTACPFIISFGFIVRCSYLFPLFFFHLISAFLKNDDTSHSSLTCSTMLIRGKLPLALNSFSKWFLQWNTPKTPSSESKHKKPPGQ